MDNVMCIIILTECFFFIGVNENLKTTLVLVWVYLLFMMNMFSVLLTLLQNSPCLCSFSFLMIIVSTGRHIPHGLTQLTMHSRLQMKYHGGIIVQWYVCASKSVLTINIVFLRRLGDCQSGDIVRNLLKASRGNRRQTFLVATFIKCCLKTSMSHQSMALEKEADKPRLIFPSYTYWPHHLATTHTYLFSILCENTVTDYSSSFSMYNLCQSSSSLGLAVLETHCHAEIQCFLTYSTPETTYKGLHNQLIS